MGSVDEYPPEGFTPIGLPGYFTSAGSGGPTTSYAPLSSPTQLTLPPGKWMIQSAGWFEYSTAAAQNYNCRIYNATGAVELDSVLGTGQTYSGTPFMMCAMVTLAVTSTIRLEWKASAVQGTQLIYAKLWAVPLVSIN